jgi:hypothetical protein
MDDSELETTLRRYRPAGPPAELRERILATPNRRTWPWAGAAAALLLSTQLVDSAARRQVAEASEVMGPGAATLVANDLAERLGGDEPARELAELIVFEQQTRNDTTASPAEPDLFPEGDYR